MNWYALYCRSNTEKLVAEKLAAAEIESYYPHLVIPAVLGRHGKRETEKKFFPGYVFARFELEHRLPVASIQQIVRILGWENKPLAIPDSEVEAVRLMVTASTHKALRSCPYLAEGERVTVTSGPLTGLEGFVVYNKNVIRVVVSVSMLGRSISAEVDAGSLRVIPASESPLKVAA